MVIGRRKNTVICLSIEQKAFKSEYKRIAWKQFKANEKQVIIKTTKTSSRDALWHTHTLINYWYIRLLVRLYVRNKLYSIINLSWSHWSWPYHFFSDQALISKLFSISVALNNKMNAAKSIGISISGINEKKSSILWCWFHIQMQNKNLKNAHSSSSMVSILNYWFQYTQLAG